MHAATHYPVTEAHRGMRLDRFLQRMLLPRRSRTKIQNAIATRVTLQSGAAAKAARQLTVGDVILISPRPEPVAAAVPVPILAEARDWVGTVFDNNGAPHQARFRMSVNGTWQFFVDGAASGTGSLVQTSWPAQSATVGFRINSTVPATTISFPFGSFLRTASKRADRQRERVGRRDGCEAERRRQLDRHHLVVQDSGCQHRCVRHHEERLGATVRRQQQLQMIGCCEQIAPWHCKRQHGGEWPTNAVRAPCELAEWGRRSAVKDLRDSRSCASPSAALCVPRSRP